MKYKNMNELAKCITLKEGKKQELSIAQVKEVLAIISDLCIKDKGMLIALLIKCGQRRCKK